MRRFPNFVVLALLQMHCLSAKGVSLHGAAKRTAKFWGRLAIVLKFRFFIPVTGYSER